MRENLRRLYKEGNKKISFTAEIAEVYYKSELGCNTILLKNLRQGNEELAEHIWTTSRDLKIRYITDNPKKFIGQQLQLIGEIIPYYHLRSRCKMLEYGVTRIRKNVAV